MSNLGNSNKNWATMPPEEIGQYLQHKVESYYNALNSSPYTMLLRNSYYTYYDNLFNGGQTSNVGTNGEFTMIGVNHFKNLLDHQKTIICQQRQEMTCLPINTDFQSLADVKVGNKLLDYYEHNKKMGKYIDRAVFHALLYGTGYSTVEWDASQGDEYTMDMASATNLKTGDLVFANYTPFDCIIDLTKSSAEEHQWHIMRKWVNRFDLIAKFPQYEEEILALPNKNNVDGTTIIMNMMMLATDDETDDVALYTFYHKKTDAVKEGRIVQFCSADLVLLSTPMPYRHYPVLRLSAGELEDTPFGYTTSFSLLQLQEMLNSLYSAAITNMESGAVNNIWVPDGCNITEPMVVGGNNYNVYNKEAGKPEVLELCKTPEEVFTMINMIKQDMNALSGISDVTRGQIPSANMSGSAMAYSNNMSLQFLNHLQQSRVFMQESQANLTISMLQDFADVPRNAAIAGKSNEAFMGEFSKKDLAGIDRVSAQTVNPAIKTPAGMAAVAQELLAAKLVNAKQYLQLHATGEIETMYEGPSNELLLIKSENEDLMEGKQCIVSVMDDHLTHISEHRFVSSNPEVRKDPAKLQAVHDHILWHLKELASLPPLIAQITNQPMNPPGAPTDLPPEGQVPQPPQGPVAPGAPGGAGGPPGPGGPGVRPPNLAGPQSPIGPGNPTQASAGQVHMPNLPGAPKGADPHTAGLINQQRADNRAPTNVNPKAL